MPRGIPNSSDHSDTEPDGPNLAGWCIFQAAGGPYLGTHSPLSGAPVAHYSLQVQLQSRPDGQLSVGYSVWPILMLPSIRDVGLPGDVITIPLDTLDAEDLARIVAAVAAFEQMLASMSAAKAGITLAPAGIKLPPAPRGGGNRSRQ